MSERLPFEGSQAKAAWCDVCKRTTACLSDAEIPFPDSLAPRRWRMWVCFECGVPVSAGRPFVPGLSRICLVAGSLLTLISLAALWLWFDGEATPGAAPVLFGFAAFSVATTLFFVRQLRRWPAYAAGVASVTPLKGDTCPICATSLVGTPPQPCDYCGVTVITQ